MILSGIKLHTPRSLREVFALLNRLPDAHLIAGGTDLIVDLKEGLVDAQNIVSLRRIKELKGITEDSGKIRIGALVTLQEIIASPLITNRIPALAEAAQSMASPQVRSIATVGGNIASAVPSADLPPILMAADATVRLQCAESSREVSLLEFFTGPRVTVCQAEEVLVAVIVPLPPDGTGLSYQKFARREANSLAVASAASCLTVKAGLITRASIVLGAVGPAPVLAVKASRLLLRQKPSSALFEEAARVAKDEGLPISDLRGSAWFRKELIQVLTRRALEEALARAQDMLRKDN